MCPDGTRWGDPGTRWELVALDLTATVPSVSVLQTLEPETSQILFQSDDAVVAVGEPIIDSISADGRYVAFFGRVTTASKRVGMSSTSRRPARCSTSIRRVSWPVTSSRPSPIRRQRHRRGGTPRVPLEVDQPTTDRPQGRGIGDVQVEAVDVAATSPSERIVWHSSVPGLGANGYSRTAGLSARLGDDGAVWALLTAGGDVEQQERMFVLHGNAATEITHDGYYGVAFDPGH